MIKKLLIANRGEIAVRIARTCRELGIGVVAVHSSADRDSEVVRMADAAVNIGPPAARHSYLHVPNIIEAALQTGADAVHPGYGFLSEDPDFAEICHAEGLTFVGPPPAVMQDMGNKATARRLMADAGLPLLPGVVEPVRTVADGLQIAAGIGYPVIIKAAAGGGGRGMTVVQQAADFADAFTATRATARAVFRDPAVYIERYLPRARHVEVQILCDHYGAGVFLGERDCSLQRRHQKLLEEGPASHLSPEQRERIGNLAISGALSVGYAGAGTMEFLVDGEGRPYFMEMNARIQVEHPVTEMITGIDLVREQLMIAGGEPLTLRQEDVTTNGVAIECRINAEDPTRGFAPAPGRLDVYSQPSGPWTRLDTGYRVGDVVSPYYDSLLGKLIVWAPTREQAIARMDRALAELSVEGPGLCTTAALHRAMLRHPDIRADRHDVQFLDRELPALLETARIFQRDPAAVTPLVPPPCTPTSLPAPSDQERLAMPNPITMNDLMTLLTKEAGLPVSDQTTDLSAGFADVGLDSLAFLAMQTALQEDYGVEMPDDKPDHYTFGEILDVCNSKLATRETVQAF
jgi:acetyl-CoA carboxylase biotin carboxylase subunit